MPNSHERKIRRKQRESIKEDVEEVLQRFYGGAPPVTDNSNKQSGWKWPVVSFAGSVGMTSLAFLVLRSPFAICSALVVMLAGFAYPVFVIVHHFFRHRPGIVRIIAIIISECIVVAFTVGVGIAAWPHEVTMTYTNAPEFNLYRKFRIQIAADSYSRFLKGIGFDVPMAAPVLGVAPGRVQAGPLPEIGAFRMTIARENLDRPDDDLMVAYGFYIISRQIHESAVGNDSDSKERISDAIWLFANYYRCSFNGRPTNYYSSSPSIEKWNNALWELRAKYGADMMNKAMFSAIQQWKPFGSIGGDANFDNYYSLRILAGIKDLDNNSEDPGKDAKLFLQKRGLFME